MFPRPWVDDEKLETEREQVEAGFLGKAPVAVGRKKVWKERSCR